MAASRALGHGCSLPRGIPVRGGAAARSAAPPAPSRGGPDGGRSPGLGHRAPRPRRVRTGRRRRPAPSAPIRAPPRPAWLTEEPALGEVAAGLAHHAQVLGGLHALGHRPDARACGSARRSRPAPPRSPRPRPARRRSAATGRSSASRWAARTAGASEDQPVPKSSIATRTPKLRSTVSWSSARVGSSATLVSVNSRTSWSGGSPESRRATRTSLTSVSAEKCRALTLTDIRSGRPSAAHSAALRVVSRSSQRVIGMT